MAWYNLGLRGRLIRALGASTPTFSHPQSLKRLQALGFSPQVIYDIGAYEGAWSADARQVFPDAQFILFEANPACIPRLSDTGFMVEHVVLASADEDRTLYLPKLQSSFTGTSLYREATGHFSDDNIAPTSVRTKSLSGLAAERGLPSPDLMKIDVQGAEVEVLEGAGALLAGCEAVLLELSLLPYNQGAPIFSDVVHWLSQRGFQMLDIAEVHRFRTGDIFQVDGLFVRSELLARAAKANGLHIAIDRIAP